MCLSSSGFVDECDDCINNYVKQRTNKFYTHKDCKIVTENTCTRCNAGFYLNGLDFLPITIGNCEAGNGVDNQECVQCSSTYGIVLGDCILNPFCVISTGLDAYCFQCEDTYGLLGGVCTKLEGFIQSSGLDALCNECESIYGFSSRVCTQILHCSASTGLDSLYTKCESSFGLSSGVCTQIVYCFASTGFDSLCTQFTSSFSFSSGVCTQIVHCLVSTGLDSLCAACQPNFTNSSSICSGTSDNCLNSSQLSDDCILCLNLFYVDTSTSPHNCFPLTNAQICSFSNAITNLCTTCLSGTSTPYDLYCTIPKTITNCFVQPFPTKCQFCVCSFYVVSGSSDSCARLPAFNIKILNTSFAGKYFGPNSGFPVVNNAVRISLENSVTSNFFVFRILSSTFSVLGHVANPTLSFGASSSFFSFVNFSLI